MDCIVCGHELSTEREKQGKVTCDRLCTETLINSCEDKK